MYLTNPIILSKAKKIKMIIFDVDGVLTDGKIIIDNNGVESKQFHVRDGTGIKIALKKGYIIAFVTGRSSEVVSFRAKELGVSEVYQKALNKMEIYQKLKKKYQLADEEIAYIGDDLLDLPLFRKVGLSASVLDAPPYIKEKADLVIPIAGGQGAGRAFLDLIFQSQGILEEIKNSY